MIKHLLVAAPELSYRPNKLHGDELVVGTEHVYTEANDEWLTAAEVEQVLQADPGTPLVLFDGEVVHRFKSAGTWKPHYISDDGYPPPGADIGLLAHLWTDSSGSTLLLFQLDC
ncbi:hypothetical protein OG474_22040 [Kribbella sp. NBC_01505]|uniref:hypothetical protein n=1 Tax=Kribbella sp. NBC_01505 TaxID=2903580 RepID=UPI00386441B4